MPQSHSQAAYAQTSNLLKTRGTSNNAQILVGFDAFIDRICHVVDVRTHTGHDGYSRISTLVEFGTRISSAAGTSAGFELVTQRTKAGGNALLTAFALATLDLDVHFAGILTDPAHPESVCPLLADAANRFKTRLLLGAPGTTDALEFDDGKLMLGQAPSLDTLTSNTILSQNAEPSYASLLPIVDALVFGNWTAHTALTDLWNRLANSLQASSVNKPQHCLVDLADITRHTHDDITQALAALGALNAHIPVTLSLNAAEASHLANSLGTTTPASLQPSTPVDQLVETTTTLRQRLDLHRLIIHTHAAAASATRTHSAHCITRHNPAPVLLTGAGDHFNAGCLLGMLQDTDEEIMLALGNTLASYYISAGTAPTTAQLAAHANSLAE
jgi:ketohexokinase